MDSLRQPRIRIVLMLLFAGALASCGGNHRPDRINVAPSYIGSIARIDVDGLSDDLLTGGLGKTGLAAASAPAYADALHPTAGELRRNAIYANYRAVLDINAASGYGSLYGPNVDAAGNVTAGEGRVAGSEYLAYANDGNGQRNVVLMVQVPANFDPQHACIITGTASGSRGIYGAIGSAGEWGLKHRCAVAYTDKGGGIGLYTFDDDGVNLIDGRRSTRTAAGKAAHFAPQLSDGERAAFAAAYPDRIAFKHAHSQRNPEADWGRMTLQAVEFAYFILNERYGAPADDGHSHLVRLSPSNTIVIASSISNGAGSALLAAEQDKEGLIGGVAASEPQIQPGDTGYAVRQGGVVVPAQGRSLFDYASFAALYQPCLAEVAGPAANTIPNAGRCAGLVIKGLLSGDDLAARQADARARLHAYGWLTDSDVLQAAHAGTNVLVAATYAYAYGRFAATEGICKLNFAATDAAGRLLALTPAQRAGSSATQNGIIGNVIDEGAVGGASVYTLGVSPSTMLPDQSLDAFICLRALATGRDPVTGTPLETAGSVLATQSRRVRDGVAAVRASGNLRGRPAVIVQGRADTLVPVNHASRAYLAANASVEGTGSGLRYVEVTHANHFDSFTSSLPTQIVPLHVYLFRALDAVYANLSSGAALPPSQVVRTVPRASGAMPITVANVPPISATPVSADVIQVGNGFVDVPD
jgi:hydroxybutyrate-dimer hydrolase